jgi:type IV pilus assembly protein PilQ
MDLAEGAAVSHKVRVDGAKILITLEASGANSSGQPGAALPLAGAFGVAGDRASKLAVKRAKAEPQLPDSTTLQEESDVSLTKREGTLPSIENAIVAPVLVDSSDRATRSAMPEPKVREVREVKETAPILPPSKAADTTLAELAPVLPVSATTASASRIKSVALGSSGENGSAVAVDLEGEPEFAIQRTAPSEYVLTIKDTKVSDAALSATLFSESQTAAIRSARSTVSGKDALVRIFVQPEVYLSARRVGGKVVVEETSDLRKVVDDMRAQLAPKEVKAAGDAKTDQQRSAGSDKRSSSPGKDVAENGGSEDKSKDASVAAKGATTKGEKVEQEMSEAELQSLLGDTARYTGKLISLDLQDTDIDNALRIIAEVSNLNIVASEEVVGKVTLRLTDVPWDQALDVILKTHALDKVLEGNVMRIAPIDKLRVERESLKQARAAEAELAPLIVKYLRVSYGKAAELKTLVETVISERGSVAYDERSNQLIVKDIESGLRNVTELVSKVDLRTPQVLLETQIVEASRSLSRDLGSELGFQYIQSPATGNGTGLNFPSAISVGGSNGTLIPGAGGGGTVPTITGSSFPAAAGASALTMLFDSADGTRSLEMRLSQLESEGRVRVVSRPAVATTNNKAAEIKSVEKYRVRLPNGGTSVATGQGSTANGTGGSATEVIEAGITLNVTPQASPDYYILLDIKAKSSSFKPSTGTDGIPNEVERSASSSVLVSSGQTFALGGIYRLQENDEVIGVPFFKDIPFFGTFFRRLKNDNNDDELLFFITPRIVEGSFDDSSMKAAS